ncbi:MAG: hypothetical protein IKO01_12710 [Kiritimatiellae bacterium]|nr:hypothetical protein [Kiritimatiellia bacterium]MBR3584290.1 hypothetical protein [Kiritimatiellia bacterium]MBR4252631.1 hypothetical protein [Kiritimatiellia bacterium]
MNPPTVKLNLDEAAGRRPDAANAAASAGKPTLRVKKSDIKEMKKRHHALSSKKKAAFGAVGALVALILGIVLWFARDSWLPYWQDRFAPADVPAAIPLPDDADVPPADAPAPEAPAPAAAALPDGPLPDPATLTYFSAAGWPDESFRQAVRHFNAAFDSYRAFLSDDTSSRPLAIAETEVLSALNLLREIAPSAPDAMRGEIGDDYLAARSLLADVRRLARSPGASAAEAAKRVPAAAPADPGATPKTWKNPDYLEGARAYNRAVAKYKEFLAGKADKQALLKEIEDDAYAAAKKFESLKGSAPAGIPLEDHITQCYKLISDCRRQQLGSPAPQVPGSSSRAHPARRTTN